MKTQISSHLPAAFVFWSCIPGWRVFSFRVSCVFLLFCSFLSQFSPKRCGNPTRWVPKPGEAFGLARNYPWIKGGATARRLRGTRTIWRRFFPCNTHTHRHNVERQKSCGNRPPPRSPVPPPMPWVHHGQWHGSTVAYPRSQVRRSFLFNMVALKPVQSRRRKDDCFIRLFTLRNAKLALIALISILLISALRLASRPLSALSEVTEAGKNSRVA